MKSIGAMSVKSGITLIGDGEWEMTPILQDQVLKLLDPNPEKRLGHNGAQEIKDHPFFKSIFW